MDLGKNVNQPLIEKNDSFFEGGAIKNKVEEDSDHECDMEIFNCEHEEDTGPVYKSHEELMTKTFKASCEE